MSLFLALSLALVVSALVLALLLRLAHGWRLGIMVTILGLTTWLALLPGTAPPLPALAALADAGIPAVLQPYRADLPHLLGFTGLVVLFTALLGRAGLAAAWVLAFATLLEAVQLCVPWREASWADLRVNLLAVVLGRVLVGLALTLGRWAWGRLTARVRVARRGMATGGDGAEAGGGEVEDGAGADGGEGA
mgnify:CR=1 FL=1